MNECKYKNKERVTLHSLGKSTPGLYRAIVLGISHYSQYPGVGGMAYIVKLIDKLSVSYEYDAISITDACMRKGWPGTRAYKNNFVLERLEK